MDPETPAARLSDKQRTYLALQNMQARIDDLEYRRREPVAIVGMSCRFPGAPDLDAFWNLLEQGIDAISEVPPDRWNASAFFDADPDAPGKAYTRWGGFLEGVDLFDATFFGISRREAAAMDPQQRLLLEVAWEALENACIPADALDGTQAGVFIGVCGCDYRFLTTDVRTIDAYLGTGSALSVLAGRISYTLGLNGPCVSVDTACSSSLVGIHLAAQSLRAGECDLALAGGVNLILRPDGHIIFSKARMMAHDGRCKTFDASADGFVRSEGCGVVVLKRLSDAVANRDRILGVVRGSAMSQDGRSNGLAAPNGTSQEEVVRRALAAAGLEPKQIQYVEAHGTGTSLGDPIEMRALGRALGAGRDRSQPFWAGSVKSNIGHSEAAAGTAAVIKTLLAMQHGVIPASLHFRQPNPYIPWDEVPVRIPTRTEPWSNGDEPRRAGVNGFGFSGTNAHVILEEAPAEPARPAAVSRSRQLLCLSARSETALRAAAGRFAAFIERTPAESFRDICYSAAIGRSHLPHRLALVAESADECRSVLQAFADGGNAAMAGGPRSAPKVAFVFTGQGAWRAGQGQALYRQEPVFRHAVDECSRLFEPHLGRPLIDAFESGEAIDPLSSATVAQAGLFCLEHALAALWRSWGIEPYAVMGHSLGEYVAACVAGVLSLEDAVTLVAARASLMDHLAPGGAMASVRASESSVRDAIAPFSRTVSIAAINGPKQVVISGKGDDVAAICAKLESTGATCVPLRVTHAFHSPLLEPILDRFEAIAERVRYAPPRTPIVSNLTGRWVDDDTMASARYWRQHMREAVRFADGVEALHAHGIGAFVEVGPEPTLLGLVRQSSKGPSALRVPSMKGGVDETQCILSGLGDLFKAGATVDWLGFSRGFEAQKVAMPTYAFERKRHWLDEEAQPADQASAAIDAVVPAASSTSLLGRQVPSPLADRQYVNRVSRPAWPFLADHRVFGTPLVPAAWYVAAAAEALERAPELSGSEVCDLTILEPLPVGDDDMVLQTVVSPDAGGESRVRIFSRASAAAAAVPWRCHSESVIRPKPADQTAIPAPPALDVIWQRCQREIPPALFYELLAARGIEYGRAFQGIRRLRVGTNEAAAEVALPEGLAPLDAMHPALLDACLQVLVAAGGSDRSAADQDLFLPVGIARCSRLGQMPSVVRVWASIEAVEGETSRGSLVLFDDAGAPVAWLSGLAGRRVTREMLGIAPEEKVEDWFYETTWQPQPLSAPGLPTPRTYVASELSASLQERATALGEEHDLGRYLPMLAEMDDLMRGYMLQALARLGWHPAVGDACTAAALRAQLGVAPRHERLLNRYLAVLAEGGWLRRDGGEWRVTATSPERDMSAVCSALTATHPIAATELQFAGRVGERLADVLLGQLDPLELLFPGGSADSAEGLYRDAPFARAINDLLGDAFERIVRSWPERRAIRVLEIGAGTGGTTIAALAHLPDEGLEYVYTDVSPLLVQHGRDRFQSRAGMSFAVFDVERDPVGQGFSPGSADVIIAANVLHATRDLRTTLRHARSLLAPGGVLLLIESVERQPLLDLIFGTTDGWWRFEDVDLRPDYPLLAEREWCALLEQSGFEEVFAAPANEPGQPTAKHKLIIGRSIGQIEHPGTAGAACLIVDDRGGLGHELARLGAARGIECIRLSPDGVTQTHDPAAMRARAAQMLRAVGRPVRDVMFLQGADGPGGRSGGWAGRLVRQRARCRASACRCRSHRHPPVDRDPRRAARAGAPHTRRRRTVGAVGIRARRRTRAPGTGGHARRPRRQLARGRAGRDARRRGAGQYTGRRGGVSGRPTLCGPGRQDPAALTGSAARPLVETGTSSLGHARRPASRPA